LAQMDINWCECALHAVRPLHLNQEHGMALNPNIHWCCNAHIWYTKTICFPWQRLHHASLAWLCPHKDEQLIRYFFSYLLKEFTLVYCKSIAIPALAINKKTIREWQVISTV
jgi:hypothetical protein